MSRKIIIFCDGGLGNRLGVLIGGLITSEVLKTTPIICWPQNNWCGCLFRDLFHSDIQVINDDINTLFISNLDNIFLIHENQTNIDLKKIYTHSTGSINSILQLNEDVVYYHNQVPYYFTIEQQISKLKSLNIQKNIIENVNYFCNINNITNEVSGIHFRKTDMNISHNENEIFNKILISNKKYFICSDDEETEKKFSKLENVIVNKKKSYVKQFKPGSWNDNILDNEGRSFNFNVDRDGESVKEAFMDLLILSRTNIETNSESSFLKFSKLYKNIKL